MDLGNLLDYVALFVDGAGAIAWAAVRGGLWWLLLGLIVIVAVFLVVRRLGWLALPSRGGWPSVVLALTLVLITWPLLIGAGIVGGLRDASVSTLRDHVATADNSQVVGAVLVMPMVAAHAVADGADVEAALTSPGDVSYLLAADRRRSAVDRVSDQVRAAVLAHLPRPDDRIGRWLIEEAVDVAIDELRSQTGRYLALFDGLRADPEGGLAFGSASRQVGKRLVERELVPLVRSPFDQMRYLLIGLAALFPLILLIAVRLVAHRQGRRLAALQPVKATDVAATGAPPGAATGDDPGGGSAGET